MIYKTDHLHWQGVSSLCTPVALTHALEAICMAEYPPYSAHTNHFTVAWRGYRGMGIKRWTGRSMSVEDIKKGVTESTPINIKLTNSIRAKRVAIVEGFKTVYREKPTFSDIQNLLAISPVIATLKAAHTVTIMGYDKRGIIIADPANRRKQRSTVPLKGVYDITEAYAIKPDIKVVKVPY